MKISSYNVLRGGFRNFTQDSRHPERIAKIRHAVRSIDADVMGLIETFRWDELYSPKDFTTLFGHALSYSIKLDDEHQMAKGRNNGITVLSRVPGTRFHTVRIHNRNAVQAIIPLKGRIVDIFTVYLDSERESDRIHQITALMDCIRKDTPTILMGDFNTFSGYDVRVEIPAGASLIADTLSMDSLPTTMLNKLRKSSVPDILKNNGFTDTNIRSVATAPTDLLDRTLLPQFLRLDYIFYKGAVSVTDFQVQTGGVFEKASDHYPVTGFVE